MFIISIQGFILCYGEWTQLELEPHSPISILDAEIHN